MSGFLAAAASSEFTRAQLNATTAMQSRGERIVRFVRADARTIAKQQVTEVSFAIVGGLFGAGRLKTTAGFYPIESFGLISCSNK